LFFHAFFSFLLFKKALKTAHKRAKILLGIYKHRGFFNVIAPIFCNETIDIKKELNNRTR
tara:strand:- start:1922 stop:2101 length:180 start_codon:yes stop_codon:yes gene_type:complete